ncbi:MAG: alpha/beta hydrolase [Phycisphaerae bacterium]
MAAVGYRIARRVAFAAVVAVNAACTAVTPPWGIVTRDENRSFAVYGRNDRTLVYRDIGPPDAGQTLLLIHGLGASKAAWRYVLPELSKSYRCIAVDLLGHGDSSRPRPFDYAMTSQAEALRDLISDPKLGVRNVVLVGSSYGGGVALELARVVSEQHATTPAIEGLVLMAPTAVDFPPPPTIESARSPLARWWVVNFCDSRALAAAMLRGAFADDSRVTPEMIDEYARCLSGAESRDVVATAANEIFQELKARDRAERRYAQLEYPILLLWGERDDVVPPSVAELIKSELPHATLEVVSGCGHTPAEECAAQTLQVLESFLTTAAARGTLKPSSAQNFAGERGPRGAAVNVMSSE